MFIEIRGVRVTREKDDGDSIRVADFEIFQNGRRPNAAFIRKEALSKSGYLKVRLLGIDTPELHYRGPKRCPQGSRRRRLQIPPQDDWATDAKKWLDRHLSDKAPLLIETDCQIYDQYTRLLGYVYTVNSKGKKKAFLNRALVEAGHAVPYQIYPNLRYFGAISKAAEKASNRGLCKSLAEKLLTVEQMKLKRKLNEPFLSRKVIDGYVCQVEPQSLLHRWIGDAQDGSLYKPKEYRKVPVPYRVFFENEAEANRAGFWR